MSNKNDLFETLKLEFQSLSSREDKTNYLLEKLADTIEQIETANDEISLLSHAVDKSELFFNLPEVNILTRDKLPHVLIKANDVVPIGDNFYAAEKFGEGDYIRWTGPDRINNFYVPIDRTSTRTLRLRLGAAIKAELFASIKLYIDGKLVIPEIEKREGGGVELVASLNISNRIQDTVVSMFIPQLYSPQELSADTTDSRKLGVAFYELEVV